MTAAPVPVGPVGRALGLLAGVLADALIADPPAGHPVAAFGAAAARVERMVYADRRSRGVAYLAVLVGGVTGAGLALERATRHRPGWYVVSTGAVAWLALGGASLARQAGLLAPALEVDDVQRARDVLPSLCGRDPDLLDATGVARAGVESVGENTVDAVVAPLLWGALAGIPGIVGHRAVNTLDAMVGYRSGRYRRFGWAPARLDDLANLLPARVSAALTAVFAPTVGSSPVQVWRVVWRDARSHPSPNAGLAEAAFAGALGLRLGGRTPYPHGTEQRPVLGDGRAPGAADLHRAVRLSRLITAAAGFLAAAYCVIAGDRRSGRP